MEDRSRLTLKCVKSKLSSPLLLRCAMWPIGLLFLCINVLYQQPLHYDTPVYCSTTKNVVFTWIGCLYRPRSTWRTPASLPWLLPLLLLLLHRLLPPRRRRRSQSQRVSLMTTWDSDCSTNRIGKSRKFHAGLNHMALEYWIKKLWNVAKCSFL